MFVVSALNLKHKKTSFVKTVCETVEVWEGYFRENTAATHQHGSGIKFYVSSNMTKWKHRKNNIGPSIDP